MKKKLLGILLLCVLALCSIGLVACSGNGDDNHPHVFTEWTVETSATCAKEGKEVRTCECGRKEQRDVAKLEHVFDEWTVETPATCAKEGKEIRTCECGEREERSIAKIEHVYGDDNICENCGSAYTLGLEYTLSDDEICYAVSGMGTATDTDIVIPSTYNGLPIKSINSYAFSYCDSLTSITIPNSVTGIGEHAFRGCSSLTSITIPNSVTSIGIYTFDGCSSLTSITIGSGVTSIGGSAFHDCTSLTRVDYMGTIDGWAMIDFDYSFSSNPLSYAKHLYINGEEVTEVNLTTATYISDYAFYNATSITKVTIGDSVTGIGEHAFLACDSLTSITIGDSVTSIGEDAFRGCSSLTSITIPNSVTSIGNYTFSGCTSLTSITIGSGVTRIGEDAFRFCDSLTRVDYTGTIDQWAMIYFDYYSSYSNPLIFAKHLYINGEEVTEVNLTTATYINNYAFYNATSITKVTIPGSVTSIGYMAFRYCTSLTSIEIPNSVTSIGDYAFYNCTSLEYNKYDNGYYLGNESNPYLAFITPINNDITTCEINNQTKLIYPHAFYNCTSLTSVTIGSGVTSIYWAFSGCTSLTRVDYMGTIDQWAMIDFYLRGTDGSYSNPLCYAEHLYINGEEVTEVNLTTATYISDYAFYNATSIRKVTIGDSVTSIGYRAFSGCDSLTSVTIGSGVTSIGYSAFEGCSSLTRITIGDSVTSIGNSTFEDCDSLTSITIPDSVRRIGGSVFSGCSSLTSVTFEGTVEEWIVINKISWADGSNLTQVICSDGTVKIK